MTSQRDVIPLGVSGLVTVPRTRVAAGRTVQSGSAPSFLCSDEERHDWLSRRLDRLFTLFQDWNERDHAFGDSCLQF